jgi:hypothetical protein
MATFAADGAPETSYRLAGVIGAGSERGLVAVIELPDGRQALFRAGDVVGNGHIREITSTHARIELAGRELLLSLRGNPKLVAEARVELVPGDDDGDREESSRRQQLPFADAVRFLNSIQGAGSSQALAAPAAADALREEINHVLEMPAGTRIVAVDQFSVDTPEEALEALVGRLSEGGVTRVAVTGAGSLETVWLAPIDEQ